MKDKRFGSVWAFMCSHNERTPVATISVDLRDRGSDLHSGQFIGVPEAKRLYAQLGKAIAYVESQKKRPAKGRR